MVYPISHYIEYLYLGSDLSSIKGPGFLLWE